MSAPAPASRRTTSGSRRFNPLKALQPKRRLQQILVSSPVPAASKPASGSGTSAAAATAPVAIPVPAPPAFDYCRFIELDYVPMESGYMVSMRPTKGYASTKSPTKGYTSTKSPDRRSTNSPSTPRSRRPPAAPSNRDPQGNASVSSGSNSGSCKGSDCSPTKGRQKYTSCTDNHGIRPPPPEQYLTPLQQKEVCIRHLRAKLKETINTLQDRDTEIDALRTKLYRMQEDWVEEECHRVEAQLALKEARQEIQQLKHAVDTVRTRLSDAGGLSGDVGVQKYFQDINTQNHKLENLLLNMEIAQAGLAKEGEAIPGCRTRAGGSAPASVSGESPGVVPKLPVGGRGSCSCDGSPARSLTRSSTYTKLSEQALGDRNCNDTDFPCLSADGTQDSGFVCCGENSVPSRADLLLEAAYLSEETASLLNSYTQTFSHTLPHSAPLSLPHTYSHTLPHSFPHNMSHSMPHTMPHSSTYEKLCTGERLAPFRCSLGGVSCMSHPCLSHHHLYLHPLREAGIQTESCPIPATVGYPSDLDTIAEQRTFRSQACSPTSTWMSDEVEEDLDSITTTTSVTTATVMSTATEPIPVSKTPLAPPLPRSATVAFSMESPSYQANDKVEEEEKQEKENREKAGEKLDNTKVRQSGEADQNSVEGIEVLDEEAEQRKVCDLAGRMQGELNFAGCCGENKQDDQRAEDKQQEARIGEISTEEKSPVITSEYTGLSPGVQEPQTSQPPRRSISREEIAGVTVVEVHDEDDDEDKTNEQEATGIAVAEDEDSGKIQKSYWSRHFLIDLLAVAIPVVPTVAWLCRGPVRGGQPMYHIGSLLRGCCTVALHSLRRGGGLRHYPAGGGDLGGTQI
ncbi:syntaphilin isoform X2 [Xiphophorus maculatus]|uniref:Syntaphilin n=1 Tax=Xiphophorus maculatus TaxID=8083 RepID=A0A3B5QVX6_XIPMA|nr:syntaphilin isoform X2 [Xiphophorus maculatus]XP_023188414.1 syntaphilin isoform X2 [Xiphophorus maculatus]XP_023188421.1 syntaphilin isoform X2 [Xiphophorus maculatus]XP_023188426.1 syntaphilin isoform X2 [Xiphophorus maculatus]XP_023188432.1 syntaphilin isoform X2 [Xiphophorus maculatus]XP_023188440.1 syntaphilin isoform X2 [Xiphophorus maculatus]